MSPRRVLRPTRENDLLAPNRVGQPRGPRNHDGTIIPDAVDTMWGTDMTTWTAEGQVAVFIALDHHNAECVGMPHGAAPALKPSSRCARACDGTSAPSARTSPAAFIRNDHGSQYMSDTFQTEMRFLSIQSSQPSSGRRREMAAQSASTGRSRRTCSDPDLQHRRRTPARLARLPRRLQHRLAHPKARLPNSRTGQAAVEAFSRRNLRVGCSQMSHQPQGVYQGAADHVGNLVITDLARCA